MDEYWSYVDMTGPCVTRSKTLYIWPDIENIRCWMWTGDVWGGYGRFYNKQAHHIIWMIYNKESIPDALWVLHKCDTKICVNLRHLFIGTRRKNVADMVAKGRAASQIYPELRRNEHNGNSLLVSSQVKQIRIRYATTKITIKELAVEYQVSEATIWMVVHNRVWSDVAKLDKPVSITKGRGWNNKKMNDDNVRSMRRDWITGNYTQQQLADKYRVKSQYTIWCIVHNKTWKHVK